MKATATTVHRLLQGSKVFLIPTFQRRYTWKLDQWEQLWNDILAECGVDHSQDDQESLHGHFLGSVVLHPAPGPASTLMRHQVIDGQQRLTTLLVFLAALRDTRVACEPQWNPSAIDDQYLRNSFSPEFPERLVPTRLDREAYRLTVREGRPTGDIGIAYGYFRRQIEQAISSSAVDPDTLERTVLLHMLLVEITTKTGDSVNSIFNTLNSKGMDLSPADLVRNEVLHHIGEARNEAEHEKYWIPMELALVNPKAKNPDREFVTFLWAREVALDPRTTREDLFPKFEKRLRSELRNFPIAERPAVAQAALRKMYEDHKLFRILRDPSMAAEMDVSIIPPLGAALARLRSWNSEPATPVVLSLLKQAVQGEMSQAEAAEALEVLLSFHVKRILNGIPTNQLNRLLTPLAHDMNARAIGTSPAEQLRRLLSRAGYYWPTEEQIRTNAETNPIYASARRYVRFLLSTIEAKLPGHESADLTKAQIEHVMPQVLNDEWKQSIEEAGYDLAEAEALTHTLGNLTLTESNQKMGNAFFDEKRERFFIDSALRLNRRLAEYDSFGPEEIRRRTQELVDLLLQEFPHGPIVASSSRELQDGGPSLLARLEAILQMLPVERWTSEDDLITALGAERDAIREAVVALQPPLARLVRTKSGTVPEWFAEGLREKVLEQEVATKSGGRGKRATADDLANLLAAADEDEADDASDSADEG